MKYKVKEYEDGKVSVIEDYDFVDVTIGKALVVKEEKVNLTEDEATYIKKDKDPKKMKKRLNEVKSK